MSLLQNLDHEEAGAVEGVNTSFIWLEVTGKCQLQCEHCYADSGPSGSHGRMSEDDWIKVIDDAANAGVEMVQFIGGEPTLLPALPSLIRHALLRELKVEIFSNLVLIRPEVWEVLMLPGVSLATSYYSTDGEIHDLVTGRTQSHQKTKSNIAQAVSLGIELRVGIIDLTDSQDVEAARQELIDLGVGEDRIGVDRLRGVGRGLSLPTEPLSQLCGRCADGVLAVMPDGTAHPCVFSRQEEFTVGNVRESGLANVLSGVKLRNTRELMRDEFESRDTNPDYEVRDCQPDCHPSCAPSCSPSCSPSCIPMGNCRPVVGPPY